MITNKKMRINPDKQSCNRKRVYSDKRRDTKYNFISFYNQYRLIVDTNPKTILEIGVGTGALSAYLKCRGFKTTTCDFDKRLNPDFVQDVRDIKKIKTNSFDTVVAFEVLEHIPFSDLDKALQELRRITKKNVIISIPYNTINIGGSLKILPFIKPLQFMIRLCELFFCEHKFNGIHYWEMGMKDFSKKKITKKLQENGFSIINTFYDVLNPVHYFFVLQTMENKK